MSIKAITRNTRLAPNILKVCLSVRQLRLDSAHRDRNYCCLFTLHESIYNKTYQTPRNRSSFHAYVWKINEYFIKKHVLFCKHFTCLRTHLIFKRNQVTQLWIKMLLHHLTLPSLFETRWKVTSIRPNLLASILHWKQSDIFEKLLSCGYLVFLNYWWMCVINFHKSK